MSRRHETLDAAKNEAEKLEVLFRFEQGKKRFIGVISFNGKCKKIAISHFSSDPRVLKNIRENVRQAVRELRA